MHARARSPRSACAITIVTAAALAVACGGSSSSSESANGDGGGASGNDSGSSVDGGGNDPGSDGSTSGNDASTGTDASIGDATSMVDLDQDGLADSDERAWAEAYLPYYSIHPSDSCKTHGIAYRLWPHPAQPKRVVVIYDVLYADDCGTGGHIGDDEVFAIVIDPQKPAPEGILAVRAISHQDTPCEHDTTCGQCSGMTACGTATRNAKAFPVVYPSKDKHGTYADLGTCSGSFICDFGGCALASAPDSPSLVNVGEPGHSLVKDLTTNGFITTANGWTHPELANFDPWKAGKFGGAGDVSMDLVDARFVVDTAGCP